MNNARPTPETDAIVRNTHTLSHMAAKLTLKCEEIERERDEAREWQSMLSSWGGTPEIVNNFIKGQQSRIHAAQNIEEELEDLREKLANVIHDLADERALADRLGNAVERYLSYQTNDYGEIITALNSWKEARKV